MNNPVVNHDAARQNIQFTANYHVRILITSVLYFTQHRQHYGNLYMDKTHEPGINLVKFTHCFGGK